MKNPYVIHGDYVEIFTPRKDNPNLSTLIDLEDLPIAQEHPNKWFALYDTRGGNYYIAANKVLRDGVVTDRKILHREITNAAKGTQVDHIDHNTLDNRKNNLRVVSYSENQLNRKSANKNNRTSGVRGVHFDEKSNAWKASVKVGGERVVVGWYKDPSDAKSALDSYFNERGFISG